MVDDDKEQRWTPILGLRRGIIGGIIAAVILAAGLTPIAYYAPPILLSFFVRVAIAWAIT